MGAFAWPFYLVFDPGTVHATSFILIFFLAKIFAIFALTALRLAPSLAMRQPPNPLVMDQSVPCVDCVETLILATDPSSEGGS